MSVLFDKDFFELIRETFVEDEYYVNDKKEPAFLISCTQIKPDKWQLIVNGVGIVDTYSSYKKAKDALIKIIENANIPVKVYRKSKHRKGKIIFASNDKTRIEPDGLNPLRVFNIILDAKEAISKGKSHE